MLFIIFLVIFVIGAILWWADEHYSPDSKISRTLYNNCVAEIVAPFCVAVGGLALLISILLIGLNHMGANGEKAALQQRYDIYTYQIENNMYSNDNDYGKFTLMENIKGYNNNLAWNKANQRNFWIGIYIPNIYDDLEFVDFSGIK